MAPFIFDLPEVMLLIIEHADLPTLSALARTRRHAWQVVSNYEASISAGRLNNFPIPPTTSVLSTKRVNGRRILPRLSLNTVRELQCREQRISTMVRSEFLAANTTIPSRARPRYLCCLERAAHLCDHISDLGCLCDGNHSLETSLRGRQAQANFIKTLPTTDLAFLSELSWIGSIGWARSMGTTINGDPDTKYKSLAFEEMVLRKGSAFLWGYALGPGEFRAHAEKQILSGADEIEDWEMGVGDQLPSLRQAVIRAFMAHKGCEFKDVWTEFDSLIVQCC
ncbi:hypothetical protein MAPG_11878 [Magnaporthiopsis poae ATCC 64411]|uniref:Uncharacterized protein n=1 Tax=Magnaporthiopsis poae (strain ATCC 64411 / 73-15) TaxID=644358 RepID=A0A0C4EGE1_MAGP6|nr:hypothetical protein MAPG_11878 [Magnaporthiopsis poae ATCC 64411]